MTNQRPQDHPRPWADAQAATATPSNRSSAALWLIGASLAVIALCLLTRSDTRPSAFWGTPAMAQSSAGARGVFAFTGQLTKNSFGAFMVDTDAGTIWCYEYDSGTRQLKLVAARSFQYDRYLEDFDTEPKPDVIKGMLDDQRQAKMNSTGSP